MMRGLLWFLVGALILLNLLVWFSDDGVELDHDKPIVLSCDTASQLPATNIPPLIDTPKTALLPNSSAKKKQTPLPLLTPNNQAPISAAQPALPPYRIEPVAQLADYFAQKGLVDAQSIDSRLRTNLAYSQPDNFIGQTLYADLTACYVLPRTAQMLAKAQVALHAVHPQYDLLLLDCARPRRVQRELWNAVRHDARLRRYVAPPTSGSLHNFGAAVDVTISDQDGNLLDMGTPYDFMGDLAQPRHHQRFLQSGQLSQTQVNNRLLLRRVMRQAGFLSIETEWWHFNTCPIAEARRRYQLLE
ncbi:MAG: hypothetical protein IPL33_21500 [Sphingobacteriales bacterium]|jgi:D-alanyl-D-alanine dipeptidase|nr:hypothetical protein [Sphingobacteriales bacterium]MCC7224093.1 hypothetical protein [Chitinophagales bacterium]